MLQRYWPLLLIALRATPIHPADLAASPPIRLLVPAYFYPEGRRLEEWKRLASAAKEVPVVAIANPASGPGKR